MSRTGHALYSIIPVHPLPRGEVLAIFGFLDEERSISVFLSLSTTLREEISPKLVMLWILSERGKTQNSEFQFRMTRVGVYLTVVRTDIADPRVDVLNSGFSLLGRSKPGHPL